MTTAKKLLSTQTGGDKLYVDDVFSTYLYTGNGTSQTINNGIDLAGEGGLVWLKVRSGSDLPNSDHILDDTVRGAGRHLYLGAASTYAEFAGGNIITSFSSSGFNLSAESTYNSTANSMASWTFRKAPKFFDIVTYTGNGVAGRQIPHELGIAPGMITSKSLSTTGDWSVYHRSATGDLKLNTTQAQTASRTLITAASDSTFTVSGAANTNGVTYVAYLWAHDDSEDGIIQCGSYVGNGSSNGPEIALGWEPQYLLIKSATFTTVPWVIVDSMRGMPVGSPESVLLANDTRAEASGEHLSPTATGFKITFTQAATNNPEATYIYLAIRRLNKPPTSGTEVYNAIARTGTGAAATVSGVGFPPDLAIGSKRSANLYSIGWIDRLRGSVAWLGSVNSNAENSSNSDQITSFDMSGVTLGADINRQSFNFSGANYINYFFRRTPGFFDVVCDTGTGAAHAINHNLTVAPELIIRKSRSASTQWEWWHSALAATEKLVLNSTAGKTTDATAFGTLPTATQFYVGASSNTNASAATYVTYLFATCPGVSKVGSYTGNGTSLSVECGFSTGARFILVKSVDDAGDWFTWDTARGIVAANDPHLSLNTAAAEVTTDDSVDPYSGGFIVNQVAATNINITGKRYIFLAIA